MQEAFQAQDSVPKLNHLGNDLLDCESTAICIYY
jgi:hypothetical protein